MNAPPVIVVEDDPFTRLIPLLLDANPDAGRLAAFRQFMAHDEPDFDGWVRRVRATAGGLYPARVCMVDSQEAMRAALAEADVLVVEALRVGRDDLAAAGRLRLLQKFGTGLRNIDTGACAERGLRVLTLRRRANISCAEHAFALMLMLARKLETVSGLVTVARINAAGFAYRPYDRRHTAGGNFARVPGTKALHGSVMGIIGLGEIGREIALRATAFGMRVLYHQRTRAPESVERELKANYVTLEALLEEADWVVPQLPTAESTRKVLGRAEFARMKPGACIVNVSNAGVFDREALLEALRGDRLGGVALDVYDREPVADDDELLDFDKLILTPRMAGSPRANALADFAELIANLAREWNA